MGNVEWGNIQVVGQRVEKKKQFKKWRVIQTETLELKIEDFFLFRRDNITWRWVPYRRRNRTKKNEKIIRNGGNVYADVDSIEILFKMKKNTIACVVFFKENLQTRVDILSKYE